MGCCSGSERHRTPAITLILAWCHWESPCGLSGLQNPPPPPPRAEESLEATGRGGGLRLETENQGGTGMTHSLPGLLCLSLLPSQRLFVLHSKYVCSLLLPSLSHLSPEPAPGGLPPLPKCTSLLGTRASHSPCCLQGLAALGAQRGTCSLLPSLLLPHSCRTGDMSWLTGKGS